MTVRVLPPADVGLTTPEMLMLRWSLPAVAWPSDSVAVALALERETPLGSLVPLVGVIPECFPASCANDTLLFATACPASSRNVTVTVDAELPSAITPDVGVAVTPELAGDTGPRNVTCAVWVSVTLS